MFVYFVTIHTMGTQVRERSLGRLGADGTVSQILSPSKGDRVGKGLRRQGDGGQNIQCDRDQHVQREHGTTTHINITQMCAHRGPLWADHLLLSPSS